MNRSYSNKVEPLRYWRTKTRLEVDFVTGSQDPLATEVKIGQKIDRSELKSLFAFAEEADARRLLVVCQEPQRRLVKEEPFEMEILPWQAFLEDLWEHKIF